MALNRASGWFTTLADGDQFTGTRWDKAAVASLMDVIDAALLVVVQATSSTGTMNDFALTTGVGRLRCANATLLTLTGLAAGVTGQLLVIESTGAGQVDLVNQSGASAAANRLINGVTGTISLAAGSGRAILEYDGTAGRWRVLLHEQGAWIAPAFAAGNFTASASMTWTLTAGDVTTYRYWLRGRTLTVAFCLDTTTVAGTPSNQLKIAIPGGFLAAATAYGLAALYDNSGTVGEAATTQVAAGGAVINVIRISSTNFTPSTNLTFVEGTMTIEVQ